MNFTDAITATCADLDEASPDTSVRAALDLALRAWRGLGDSNPVWDPFGLDVLAADELLRDLPAATVACGPPSPNDVRIPGAVRDLVHSVADHLDRNAADETLPLVDRLTFDAAAGQLRRAGARLP